jgi:hypothetical protein
MKPRGVCQEHKRRQAEAMSPEQLEETRRQRGLALLKQQQAAHQAEIEGLRAEMRAHVLHIQQSVEDSASSAATEPNAEQQGFSVEVAALLRSLEAAPRTVSDMEGLHDGQNRGFGRGGGRKAAAVAGHSKVVARATAEAEAAAAESEVAMKAQLKQQEMEHAKELSALRGALRQELESLHHAAEEARQSLHISPAQQQMLESQIAAARAALEASTEAERAVASAGGVQQRSRTRGAGGRETALMQRREAALEAKYGPAPVDLTVMDGETGGVDDSSATPADAARQAHLRKQLFWQGEKSRLQYAQQKAVLKAELAEMMVSLRDRQTHAEPEELEQFQAEVEGLRLMLERQDWMDDSERQYLDLEAAVEVRVLPKGGRFRASRFDIIVGRAYAF